MPALPRAIAAALLALGTTAAAGEPDWLARMHTALAGSDYHGTLVYLRDGQLDALELQHRHDAGGAVETLRALTGAERVVRRDGATLALSIGDATAAQAAGGEAAADPVDLPAAHYAVVPLGRDRVADTGTDVIEIRPRDGYRWGWRLWLAPDSGLPLKSQVFGADGRAVEQWMFTRFELDRPVDPAAAGAAPSTPEPSLPDQAQLRWQPPDLPPGYRLLAIVSAGPDGEHHLYGDGMSRVSLYIEPLDPRRPNLSGLVRRGATSLFGRVLDGHQVTVVGQVPPATVERIARGLVAPDAR